MRSFGSDNHSGVHPAIMAALQRANADHTPAYGDDPWTERALARLKEIFGADTESLFVLTGTGANILAVASFLRPFNAIVCSAFSHMNRHESSGPETFTGCKVIAIESENAKLTPELIEPHLQPIGDTHSSQPLVISITQPNEYGMLYTPEEVKRLAQFAHSKGLFLHMDGARIANACAALGLGLREATRDLGVDVLSLGGTKNGLMFGEAVVFFSRSAAAPAPFYRKMLTQLASKMRFVSAQFEAYLTGGLWLENAKNANEKARKLADSVKNVPGVSLSRPVQTNMVCAHLDPELLTELRKKYLFYLQDEATREARWVISFDTTDEDLAGFVSAIRHTESN